MDEQGMVSYVGCRHIEDHVVLPGGTKTTCRELVAHRVERADLYFMAFDPPEPVDVLVATTIAWE